MSCTSSTYQNTHNPGNNVHQSPTSDASTSRHYRGFDEAWHEKGPWAVYCEQEISLNLQCKFRKTGMLIFGVAYRGIMKGVCTVFRELLQGPPTYYVAYEDLENLNQFDLDEWEDDNRARGITGLPDNIYVFHEDIPLAGSVASVARFNYETNFDAFFIKTMIFYCENDDREKYSVVFGQVEDMDLVRNYQSHLLET
jgi:hypothetical protein